MKHGHQRKIGEQKPEQKTEKQSQDRFTHLKGSELKSGQKYLGKYMGSYTDKMYGDNRHMLQTPKGEVLVFREWAQLKSVFDALMKGDVVEIEFVGKKDIGKGRKVMEFKAVRLTDQDAEYAELSKKDEDDDEMPF